jgi:hypothetical protein
MLTDESTVSAGTRERRMLSIPGRIERFKGDRSRTGQYFAPAPLAAALKYLDER